MQPRRSSRNASKPVPQVAPAKSASVVKRKTTKPAAKTKGGAPKVDDPVSVDDIFSESPKAQEAQGEEDDQVEWQQSARVDEDPRQPEKTAVQEPLRITAEGDVILSEGGGGENTNQGDTTRRAWRELEEAREDWQGEYESLDRWFSG